MLELDNFRYLTGYGWTNFKRQRTSRQDKGHQAEIAAFLKRVSSGGPPLIPAAELYATTLAAIVAQETAAEPGRSVTLT